MHANDRQRTNMKDFITGSALHNTYTVTIPFRREFQHPYKTHITRPDTNRIIKQ